MSHKKVTYENFQKRVAQVMPELDQLKVKFVLIKTVKCYRYADSNLDILLPDPSDYKKVKTHFESKGFKAVFTFEFDKAMLMPPEDDPLPAIHLYSSISWYTVSYLDATQIVARGQCVEWEGLKVPIPSPEDDYLIYAMHGFFEEESLNLGDMLQLLDLQQRIDRARLQSLMEGKTTQWVLDLVETDLPVLKAANSSLEANDDPKHMRQELKHYSEVTMLKAFGKKISEDIGKGRWKNLLMCVWAYGIIHVAKRLRIIRG